MIKQYGRRKTKKFCTFFTEKKRGQIPAAGGGRGGIGWLHPAPDFLFHCKLYVKEKFPGYLLRKSLVGRRVADRHGRRPALGRHVHPASPSYPSQTHDPPSRPGPGTHIKPTEPYSMSKTYQSPSIKTFNWPDPPIEDDEDPDPALYLDKKMYQSKNVVDVYVYILAVNFLVQTRFL